MNKRILIYWWADYVSAHFFVENIVVSLSSEFFVLSFCPRGFVIPESIKADMSSARVADPQLITLWIANPQGQEIYRNKR